MARILLDTSQPDPYFTDGLGARFVRNPGTDDAVDVLRLCPELSAMRESIRERVGRLASFRQACFVPVRSVAPVVHLPNTLDVVSDHVPCIRLCAVLDAAHEGRASISTAAALGIVRGLLGALAVLAESRGVTHGAIGPERVVITPRGRLLLTDYVFGLALERLELPRRRLWRDFRIPLPGGIARPCFDEGTDLAQVGLVAVALLLGRAIEPNEFPARVESLADSIGLPFEGDRRGAVEKRVKAWLRTLLGIDEAEPFAGARHALTALDDALSRLKTPLHSASAATLIAEAYRLTAGAAAPLPVAVIPDIGTRGGANAEVPEARAGFDLRRSVGGVNASAAPVELSARDEEVTRAVPVELLAQPLERPEPKASSRAPGRRRERRAIDTVPAAEAGGDRGAARVTHLALAALMFPVRVARVAARAGRSGTEVAAGAVARAVTVTGVAVAAVIAAAAALIPPMARSVAGVASGARAIGRGSARLLRLVCVDAACRAGRGAGTVARALLVGLGSLSGGIARLAPAAGAGMVRAGVAAIAALDFIGGAAVTVTAALLRASVRMTCAAGVATTRQGVRAGRSVERTVRRAAATAAWRSWRVFAGAARGAAVTGRAIAALLLRVAGGAASALAGSARLACAGAAALASGFGCGARAAGALLATMVWRTGQGGAVVTRESSRAAVAILRSAPAVARATRQFLPRERRIPVLAGALLLAAAVAGGWMVSAHWSDGVAVAVRLSGAWAANLSRIDPGAWWQTAMHSARPDTPETGAGPAGGRSRGVADSGGLRVASDPDGAEVWLDGELQGVAPLALDGVPAGPHTVQVRARDGSVRRSIRVLAGRTEDVNVRLASGWLVVFASIRLEVFEKGRSLGSSESGRIRLSPGDHQLEIVSERVGFRVSRSAEVKPGETVAVNVELPQATIEIVGPPDADVLVDGQMVGRTPLDPVPVAVGTREVTLRHPALGEQRQFATVTYRTQSRIVFGSSD